MSFNKTWLRKDWFIGLVLVLLFLIFAETDVFETFDRGAYNLGVELASARDPHEDIVVVAVDDKSLQSLGAWPWSRDVLAETTQILARARPSVIGFTMPFDTPQYEAGLSSLADLREILRKEKKLSRRVNRALRVTESTLYGDDNLAGAFRKGGRIVLAMPYIPSARPVPGLTTSLPGYMQKFALPNVRVNGADGWSLNAPEIVGAEEIFPPIEKLARQVGGIGLVGHGEHFRREPLIVRYGQEFLPSFALMMTTRSKGLSMQHIESRANLSPVLGGKDLGADRNFRIYPRFYEGQNGKSAFKIYSLIDVLDGSVSPVFFRNKIVLVGLTSPRLAQPMLTPAGDRISPTVATAHTISSLLNGEVFRLPEWAGWALRGLILGVGLYLMFVLGRFRANTAFFLSLFLVVMILNTHFVLMSSQALWVPMMTAVAMLLVGHLVMGLRHFVDDRLSPVRAELSVANRQLGQALHAQGQLDQAFEKFRSCEPDASLLSQTYNLGLDYERKRQFNKAVSVFKFIEEIDPKFNDVGERIERNEQASKTVVLGGNKNGNLGETLVASKAGLQKPKLGRYEIDSEIGRGAMGMVYMGHDDKIGRKVAIKTMMISEEIEDDMRDEVRTRFFREAEAAGRLDHPNIVTVYDVGEEQDLAYIAMDYLKGKDLTAYTTQKSRLPVSEVFDVIHDVAMALDYAHSQHVVHRDIKPANIIYDRDKGSASLTDFGVACLTDASKTKTGTVLGSPYYMSPEQLAGKKVDGRADLFSLGVTLYQLITSELPFKGDSIANLMYNIANEQHLDVRRYRQLPACVANLVNKALQKDAASRFQSGKQMAAALKRCQPQIREMEAA